MFELEDELTGTIARELRGSLASARGLSGSDLLRGTDDQQAYDLYLRGRYAWSKRGDRLRTAIDLVSAALARDPKFARPPAGLAMAWVIMPMFMPSVASSGSALAMAQRSG